jgi:FKBP-type peptidyl-prolyl cis-trans isomerase
MFTKLIVFAGVSFLIFSCDTEGIKKDPVQKNDVLKKNKSTNVQIVSNAQELLKPTKVVTSVEDKTGIEIKWFEQGKGEVLTDGEVVKINYDVRLVDGTLVDGNELLKRDWLPFLIGFGMQTKGWDIAFKKLRVGDFVEIVLPSNMARGKDGVKGLIPPNAVNIIHLRVLDKISPTRIIDGTKVWLLEENESNKLRASVENTVEFHYMVGTQSNPKYDISYRRNQPYSLKFSDFGIVKGLKKALISAKRADKIWILVPPSEAYGDKGLVDLVKPGESLFYDIFVTDVR